MSKNSTEPYNKAINTMISKESYVIGGHLSIEAKPGSVILWFRDEFEDDTYWNGQECKSCMYEFPGLSTKEAIKRALGMMEIAKHTDITDIVFEGVTKKILA